MLPFISKPVCFFCINARTLSFRDDTISVFVKNDQRRGEWWIERKQDSRFMQTRLFRKKTKKWHSDKNRHGGDNDFSPRVLFAGAPARGGGNTDEPFRI
jgi:hypothetical protein